MANLREKAKSHERQLVKEQQDRKNQLNIMKTTHEKVSWMTDWLTDTMDMLRAV